MKTPDHPNLNSLASYANGLLDDAEEDRISAHIEACPTCLEALESLESTEALLEHMAPQDAPETFANTVERRIRRRSRQRFFRRSMSVGDRTTYVVACAVLAILAALYLFAMVPPAIQDPEGPDNEGIHSPE